MSLNQNLCLEDSVLSTNAKPLSLINVGITNELGEVERVITLEEFARVGCSQPIQMQNHGKFGEVEYELTVSNSFNLSGKVAYWRAQQNEKGGKRIDR